VATVIMKPYERRRDLGPVARLTLWALLVLVSMVYGVLAVVLPIQMMSYPAIPIFIMVAIILWIVPDTGGVDYERLRKVMIPYLALSIAWPNYVAFNLPGLPWISLTRGALLIVLLIFAWNLSTSSEMRGKLREAVSAMPLAIRAFWLFWATTVVSMVFSNSIGYTITKFINNQIYWTMALFVTALLAGRPGFVMQIAKTVVAASALVIVYSLYEYRIEQVAWLDYLPAFLKIDPVLFETLIKPQARSGTGLYRVRGPYAAALYFSEFLTMVYPFLLHFTFRERRFVPFVLYAGCTLGCFAVMVMTDARSALIGFLVASFLYIFYNALRQRTQNPRSIMSSTILFGYPTMIVVVTLIVWFWNRAHVMVLGGGQHAASSQARSIQWDMAWPKIFSHPLGHGIGRGNDALGYTNLGGTGTVDSYFITVMMDSGLLALPFFMLTFLIPAWYAFNNHRDSVTPEEELLAPLSLALINFSIVKSVLSSEASIPLAFVYVGCIYGLLWQRKNRAVVDTLLAKEAAEAAAVPPPLPLPPRWRQGPLPGLAMSRKQLPT